MEVAEAVDRIGTAAVGVLGYVRSNGEPNAAAVTPYVVGDRLVVTSTLAFVDKAAALRRDPRVTLTAGGVSVAGRATVEVDTTPAFFDAHLRAQELEKFPPSRLLLRLPGHRRLLAWYVARVLVWIEPEDIVPQAVRDDRTTVSVVHADGRLRTTSAPTPDDLGVDRIPIAGVPGDGPAALLVHHEDAGMRTLRQLSLHGQLCDGVLHVAHRRGALDGPAPGALAQLGELVALGRRARVNRERVASWPRPR